MGALVKDAKEQLRALPDGLTYGLLRYLNPDVDLTGPDPSIGFNYLGRLGGPATRPLRRSVAAQPGRRVGSPSAATAVPMPLAHTVELNAGTMDTDAGPYLHADWTWAPSALDRRPDQPAQPAVVRGPGRHLRPRRSRRWRVDPVGHHPRPAQPAADRRTRSEQYRDRRRPAADPAAAGTALPRQHPAQVERSDDLYAMQLDITITGPLDPHRLRDAVRTVVSPPPQPGRPILPTVRPTGPGHPGRPRGRLAIHRAGRRHRARWSRSSGCAPPNAPRCATWPNLRPFGWR